MNSQEYQAFQQHPFIQSIKETPKWTISNEKKIPLDMRILMTENRIHGANFYDEQSLTTLTEIDSFFNKQNLLVTNHAFFLDVVLDGFVVLDIEPDCPDDIKQKLLNTPYIYGEVSLSGKGYHLVFRTPQCFMDYPNAHTKPALKDEDGNYEILLNHFCTFTAKMIQPPANPTEDFNKIYKQLAENAKNIAKQREVDISTLTDKPDTKYADRILALLKQAGLQWNKRPDNFKKDKHPLENDPSRYEWAYLAYLYKKLDSIMHVSAIADEHTYTEEEQAFFLYTIIQELIPHREKHDTYRLTSDGTKLPWLGYLIKDVMEKVDNDEKGGEKQND